MNAVICLTSLPLMTLGGVTAMTMRTSAMVPLVHHNFSPLRRKCFPSSVGVAVVVICRGSEPTDGSVKAKADTAPLANVGKYFFFCSGEIGRASCRERE